jgi:hypothetical protein
MALQPQKTQTAPELGLVGRELLMRLLGQQEGEPVQALTNTLANAYGALVDGDFDMARAVLTKIMGPVFDLERAILTLQRANSEVGTAAEALAGATPPEIDADVAFNGLQLDTWREALEAHIAAQMELIERLKILQQLAATVAPEPVSI